MGVAIEIQESAPAHARDLRTRVRISRRSRWAKARGRMCRRACIWAFALAAFAMAPVLAEAQSNEVLAPSSPILVRTERYQPGTVIAELRRTPNYPQTGPMTAPASVKDESFVSATLLGDGTFVVDTGLIRVSKVLSPSNFETLRGKSALLARANVRAETSTITCTAMPPPTRTRLAVAASDAAGTRLSDDLGTVWLEEGCSYSLRLIHENPRELEVAAEVRAKVESIAHDLIDL